MGDKAKRLVKRVAQVPAEVYQARLGWLLANRFVLIHHMTRATSQNRHVVVEVIERDPAAGTVTVAGGFGDRWDWYRDLRASPDTMIELGDLFLPVRATFLSPHEGGELLYRRAMRHPWRTALLCWALGFEPCSRDHRSIGERIGFVRFQVRKNLDGYSRPGVAKALRAMLVMAPPHWIPAGQDEHAW